MINLKNIMVSIGQTIKNYRKKRGWSQEELGHQSGLHTTYIGKLERAEKVCSVEVLAKITESFEVSLTEFFSHIQSPNISESEERLLKITNEIRFMEKKEQERVLKIIELILEGY
ncbi:helix-turn-helix domain-containing protein [Paenibacillus polymyxa]|uniref:helix-turn-helix domain-containing protein n=1 Tax=Paenibacillus polymyxa TaxID=1406 RepID=UPI0015D5A23E|nr:helix-turn-helix transcriptional regulator [Paenibacillus polymyxa]WDM22306.1 helix-turn-helix transcriptional regulator [Paenibacillus polymyxa]